VSAAGGLRRRERDGGRGEALSETRQRRPEPGESALTEQPKTAPEAVENAPPRHSGALASDHESDELVKAKRPPLRKRLLLLAVAVVSLSLGVVFGVPYYDYLMTHEWTDDAFIEGHLIPISSKVPGRILRIYVTDNQEVRKGELLAEIDPRDYVARLAQARAALQAATARQTAAQINVDVTQVTTDAAVTQAAAGVEAAKAAVQTAQMRVAAARSQLDQARSQVAVALANVEQARAQVAAAEAEATRAHSDLTRMQELHRRNQVAQQDLDHAVADAHTAKAQLDAARKKVTAAEAQVAEARAAQQVAADNLRQAEALVAQERARLSEALGRLAAANAAPHQVAVSRSQAALASAEVEQARAAVAQAELDLSYTKISAPEAGRVTRKVAEEGAYVQVGQALMVIVPDDVWVVANFKETQLAHIRRGQAVEITVDAYPGKVFKGHVDSIQAGTGARFSLLPPENATGNFVKVVQRVPVKIVLDDPPDPQHLLGPGMSVVPVVKLK
jgi:membrane fusion protein (multidrug efflux system)